MSELPASHFRIFKPDFDNIFKYQKAKFIKLLDAWISLCNRFIRNVISFLFLHKIVLTNFVSFLKTSLQVQYICIYIIVEWTGTLKPDLCAGRGCGCLSRYYLQEGGTQSGSRQPKRLCGMGFLVCRFLK